MLSAVVVSGCGGDDATNSAPADVPATADINDVRTVTATFSNDAGPAEAFTYDDALPIGGYAEVTIGPAGEGTEFTLTLDGVEADREFGAHLHTNPCGPDPGDSGPHYQDVLDPVQPSTDPEYANPENEVWLDLTTDGTGHGHSETSVGWTPRTGEANSVVIHEKHTMTGPGEAGMAGDRLGCVDVLP
ncbi:superoxide dismutase family protein [Phytoactinopolyspora mesophila]|uniref:superoxide dismutase family protein n=1 Tax=Phytoactinopolyspora mesophila TaxID=2650750 RepID=UPI001C9E8702|nr:superoxide dismutase family protein [Phytoactinopolyspora mesophila]